MKDTLAVGLMLERKLMTTPEMGVSHLGEGNSVLSSPSMIGVMEYTCLDALTPHLDENEQSVGTMVHVFHRAACLIGTEVICRCKLIEKDRKRMLFEVEVKAGDLVIGEGTHQRFIIDTTKFNR